MPREKEVLLGALLVEEGGSVSIAPTISKTAKPSRPIEARKVRKKEPAGLEDEETLAVLDETSPKLVRVSRGLPPPNEARSSSEIKRVPLW